MLETGKRQDPNSNTEYKCQKPNHWVPWETHTHTHTHTHTRTHTHAQQYVHPKSQLCNPSNAYI